MGILACGACTAGEGPDGLFPIALHVGLFAATEGLPVLGPTYTIFEKDEHFPGTGSFGWLSWNTEGGHTSNVTLAANMADTTRCCTPNPPNPTYWSITDDIPTGPGVMNSNAVLEELAIRIDR